MPNDGPNPQNVTQPVSLASLAAQIEAQTEAMRILYRLVLDLKKALAAAPQPSQGSGGGGGSRSGWGGRRGGGGYSGGRGGSRGGQDAPLPQMDRDAFPPQALDGAITFGKWNGRTYADMLSFEEGRGYLNWMVQNAVKEHGSNPNNWKNLQGSRIACWALQYGDAVLKESPSGPVGGGYDEQGAADDVPF